MRFGNAPKLLVALSIGVSAVADAQTGSRVAPPPARIPDTAKNGGQRARQAMIAFAQCSTRRDRLRVERFLATAPATAEADKLARSLATDECLSAGEMKFDERLFRWAFYDMLYRQKFSSAHPADFSTYPAFQSPLNLDTANEQQRQSIALMEMGDCVVRGSPAGAHALAISPVTTATEDRAFSALMPTISACVPQNSQITFSKTVLRGVIIQALYTMSSSSPATGATGQ